MFPLLDLARPSRTALIVGGGHCVSCPTQEAKLPAVSMMFTVCFHGCFSRNLQGWLYVHARDRDGCW